MYSFDTASLAILERLTHLEGLFRAAHPDTHDLEEQPSPVVSSSSRENGPPDFFRINVEAVLEWPILQPVTQDQPLSLANIFQAARTASDSSAPRLLATSDLDPGSTGPLLQCFMDNFHIYNPVLEIARIQQDIKTTLFNGLGWDAASCILVCNHLFSIRKASVDGLAASSVCSRNHHRPCSLSIIDGDLDDDLDGLPQLETIPGCRIILPCCPEANGTASLRQ